MTRLLAAALVTIAVAGIGDALAVTRALQPDGWRSLFDGRSTAGWRGYRQQGLPAGWTAVEGALTRTGKGGDIITVEEFSDFELALEWRVAPNANSGVFFRVTEDATAMWHTAPEIQVIDNAYKGGLQPAQTAGANYDLHAPAKDVTKAPGEWNAMRVVASGNHVEHWLNDVKVVEYEIGSADWLRRVEASKFKQYAGYGRARRGHIGIQDHGDAVAYRNIRIRPL